MKVHLIAIGGSAMHNLAIALRQMGHHVTGSDDAIFEPSQSRLARHQLLPEALGWHPERIDHSLDGIILGMHAKIDNPELVKARELELKIWSYPEFIYEQSQTKTRVVIAGSHGKTSISAMILHALHYHGRPCDYLVGAQLEGFDNMVHLHPDHEFILLEGDEYLSSPLDRRPKFLHYRANIALLSGIAWDHINVFPTYEGYLRQFDLFLSSMEAGGALVYCDDDPEVKKLVEGHSHEIKKFPYREPAYRIEEGRVWLETPEGDLPLHIFGRHNLTNLEGARWICNQMGLTDEEFYEAIAEFKGASRRLEKIVDRRELVAYRDFAHAPSKVEATVKALREIYPQRPLIALLELHTYSSLNKEFLPQYRHSLAAADEALVYFDPEVVALKRLQTISNQDIIESFDFPGLKVENERAGIETFVADQSPQQKPVFLIMSSGNFTGIDWATFLA